MEIRAVVEIEPEPAIGKCYFIVVTFHEDNSAILISQLEFKAMRLAEAGFKELDRNDRASSVQSLSLEMKR